MAGREEMVAHPRHYNSHPSGTECIDVIRHYVCDIANAMKYLWRAGLKGEDGMTLRQKEVEDCRKAIFYLKDYLVSMPSVRAVPHPSPFVHPSGIECEAIASCYSDEVARAFRSLWFVGLVVNGVQTACRDESCSVKTAIESIERHIAVISEGGVG